jgi:hypothetical protein
MAMDMPYTDSRNYPDLLGNLDELIGLHPSPQLFHIGAVDVIKADDPGDGPHVVFQCVCEGIIHVHLPASWLAYCDYVEKRSQTALLSDSLPWNVAQNSHAGRMRSPPTPVASSLPRLALAWLTAL